MYSLNQKFDEVINQVIKKNKEFSHLANVTIKSIVSEKPKTKGGKTVYASTEKVNDKFKYLTDIDFIITFYPIAESLTPEKLEILVFHELLHIGYDPAEEKRFIVPHDVEDFAKVIDKFGVDWVRR